MHRATRSSSPRPDTSAQTRWSGSRRRRHTACVRCAELRRKCTGGSPCDPCNRNGHNCQFPITTGRISRSIRTDHSENAVSDTQEKYRDRPTDSLATDGRNAHEFSGPGEDFIEAHGPTQKPNDRPEAYVPAVALDTLLDPVSGIDDIDSWAWVHESMYLQSGDLVPLTEQNATHNIRPSISTGPLLPELSHHGTHSQQHALAVHGPHATLCQANFTQQSPHSSAPAEVSLTFQRSIVIEDLVNYAVAGFLTPSPRNQHGEYWSSKSAIICASFDLDLLPQHSAVQHFMDLYLMHFWPLWPVLAKQELDIDSLHPLLCLVLVSIGAMYGGPGSVVFGCMMHSKVRTHLTMGLDLEHDDDDFTWLAQARLYTQVAALYFGQARAFTYGQHLGALLIAQARRMGLYSADLYERAHQSFELLRSTGRDTERLATWLQLEGRRRLAFGVFRADTYASVLLDMPPLLSMEEIEVTFPSCDAVWRADAMPAHACLHMIDHDRSPCRQLRASEVYLIALEPEEPLPVLEPVAHELLQFGLQGPLGRFRYGHTALPRLTGSSEWTAHQDSTNSSHPSVAAGSQPTRQSSRESTSLATVTRRMTRLVQEYRCMLQSQIKWEGSLPVVKTFLTNENDRGSLMSGLVLFHLGHLRLHAPISKLHQLQYRLSDHRSLESLPIAPLKEWTSSSSARLAAQHSCALFSLVAGVINEAGSKRIKFNLLAFIGLHHAAVILWSYMGSSNSNHSRDANDMYIELPDHTQLAVCERNSEVVMQAFVDLFYSISPGSWSSFAEAAVPLVSAAVPWKTGR